MDILKGISSINIKTTECWKLKRRKFLSNTAREVKELEFPLKIINI